MRARGLAVPGDVSVVGYDDSPLIAFTDPPLTTVRQPVAAMGAAAVRALLEEIGGGHAPHTRVRVRAGAGGAGIDGVGAAGAAVGSSLRSRCH